MKRLCVFLSLAAAVCAFAAASDEDFAEPPANLNDILQKVGLTRGSLTINTAPDWIGHVPASSVPYRLPHIDPVLSDPFLLARLGGNLSGVAHTARDGSLPSGQLTGLLTAFTLHPRLPTFRGLQSAGDQREFSPGNLTALLTSARAHDGAATVRYDADGWHGEFSGVEGEEEKSLPAELRRPIAHLLGACIEASWWITNSWRATSPETIARATSMSGVTPHLSGADRYYPEISDAFDSGDEAARAYAAVLLTQAIQEELPNFREIKVNEQPIAGLDWQVGTDLGRIVVSGSQDATLDCRQDCLMVIDLGGNTVYTGTVGGATFPSNPVSILIDLGGDDEYHQKDNLPAQGAGKGGVGILVDVAGDDTYNGTDGVQGWGFLGYGMLWDLAGTDRYIAESASQGAALFGGGLLADQSGNDSYRTYGESQGFGGPGGAGALVDLDGDDLYYAEPSPALAGRADYHSEGKVAANTCQGAGIGRRGDLTDGHSWAGGIGVLADAGGNDSYTAGNFSQGIGYWFGTGLLLDGGGDDAFRTVYFTQGSGLHFGAGLFVDESGNDIHDLQGEAGASLGYAWDFGIALFLDGSGDDTYSIRGTGLGCAERRSVAVFVDGGGADAYRFGSPVSSLGAADARLGRADPLLFSATSHSAAQAGLFIDLGGGDVYTAIDPGEIQFRPGNNRKWVRPRPDDDAPSRPNRGAGVDLAGPPLPPDRALLHFFRDTPQTQSGKPQ